MCLSVHDFSSIANKYSHGITYLKTKVTTFQRHKTDRQKPVRKELRNNKESHQTIKGKRKIQNQLENEV